MWRGLVIPAKADHIVIPAKAHHIVIPAKAHHIVIPAKAGIQFFAFAFARHPSESWGSILILLWCAYVFLRHGAWLHSPSASLRLVSSPSAGSESLLFACPKRSNQEKGHPADAPSGYPAIAPALLYLGHPCPRPALQDRESGPGFSTVRPCTGENARASGNCSCIALPRASMPSPARAPAGLIVPASLASEGPRVERRASCAQKRDSASLLALGVPCGAAADRR